MKEKNLQNPAWRFISWHKNSCFVLCDRDRSRKKSLEEPFLVFKAVNCILGDLPCCTAALRFSAGLIHTIKDVIKLIELLLRWMFSVNSEINLLLQCLTAFLSLLLHNFNVQLHRGCLVKGGPYHKVLNWMFIIFACSSKPPTTFDIFSHVYIQFGHLSENCPSSA